MSALSSTSWVEDTYVEIASVLVANTAVALVCVTALGTGALIQAVLAARVGSVGVGNAVSLPDIHLWAACAVLSGSSVLVIIGWLPSLGVGSTVDPLNVVRALSVTVSYSE